ncbi:hypothetical protein PF010_g26176, partial [Phytophthora fragariae]
MPLANCYMRVIYSYLFPLFAAITFGIATPIAFISMYWTKHRLALGFIIIAFNLVPYASPLETMKKVVQTKNASSVSISSIVQ